MYNISFNQSDNKVPEIKIIAWLFYDITMLGIGGYSFANAFVDNVNMVEKILLFLASMIFFGYRIYILHLDAEKKKMDNKDYKKTLDDKWGHPLDKNISNHNKKIKT